jgi:hypothetical protein
MQHEDLAIILRRGRRTMRRHRISCNVSLEAFKRWLLTPTPYPNPSFETIVRNPYLVIHELVEIAEIRRLGLRMTKDINFRHADRIGRAHSRRTRRIRDRGPGGGTTPTSAAECATRRGGSRIRTLTHACGTDTETSFALPGLPSAKDRVALRGRAKGDSRPPA